MARTTAPRVIGMWTRVMLDELAPDWRTSLALRLRDAAALRGTDAYIAHEDMVALWSHFTDSHADPLFGLHFAERHVAHAVGMYSYVAAHAPDFGTAARTSIQLRQLIDTHSEIAMLAADDGGITMRHTPPPEIGHWPRHLAESLVGGVLYLGRAYTGLDLVPRDATFQHGRGADTNEWFGCAVRYDQPSNELSFDKATVDLPFRLADATHHAAILAAATRTLDEVVPPSTFLDEARAALRTHKGRSSVAQLARSLGMSERTLQRRLSESGATFRQLLDEVRVELLAENTSKEQKSHAMAEALGFADPSSVRRLRKRWRRPKR